MPGFKRFRKYLLLFGLSVALILLFSAGALYYFVHFRFAESLSYLVSQESQGRYALETGEANISLWKRTIAIKQAHLYCRDTANTDGWMEIHIPELYFSMGSWKTLLSQRKLMVDSLSILRPDIGVHILRKGRQGRSGTVKDLQNILDSTMRHLQIRSFSLQDAAFTLIGPSRDPLHGDHINVFVTDFSEQKKGRISVSLGPQHWVKPESGLTLDLARLVFDSRDQRFEVDSLSFTGHPDTTRPKFGFTADRLYFTSHDLMAIYREGGLSLDSLVCINPVVTLPPDAKGGAAKKGPGPPAFFNYIHVRTVSVLNGRVNNSGAGGGRTATASTRKADLRIFGLHIDGSAASAVTTDSIGVDLHHLEFLSKDGAHRLTIEEFGLSGNDAVFRQVRLAPTHPEPGNIVVFTAPRLLIRDISIPDLLRNHLRAAGAQLDQPTIDLTDTRRQKAPQGKMKLLYTTMRGLRQLIDAPHLDIVDGTQHFKLGGATPVEVTAKGLRAHILLNKLFLSDSLFDIKQALPLWKVADFELISEPVQLSALDYELNGGKRSSVCRQARVSIKGGWQLNAKDIFWDALSWDQLQETGTFHIDSLHLGSLIVSAGVPPAANKKAAPPIAVRLDRLLVDSVAFERPAADSGVRFTGGSLQFMGLSAGAGGLHWDRAKAALRGLSLRQSNFNLTIAEGEWNSESGVGARDLTVSATAGRGALDLRIPVATLRLVVHSTDVKTLPPITLSIPQAGFLYTAVGASDTLRVEGQLRLTVSSGRIFPHLSGAVDIALDKASGYRHTADALFSASGLSGAFHDANFEAATLKNTDWRSWLAKTTLTQGQVQVRTKKLKADLRNCTWAPTTKTFSLTDFAVSPILGRDASLKQAAWQSDYVTVRGRSLTLAGIRFDGDPVHPSVIVPKIILDGAQVEASRDKHIPFRHGMEKAMPTKLLAALHFAVRVDTVQVLGARVTYNEWPVTSSRWTSLTIDDLNGQLLDLHTRPASRDTLRLTASGRLFDGRIRRFSYSESYADSLSGFTARCSFSAFDLTQLSSILVPTASVSVVRGHVDTIWSVWQGNRYAAHGTMGLYYDRLRVSVLNKKDSSRRNFLPVVETWAANLLLPGRNKRQSPIFFERDREKFIFNYWVKSQASGILSALLPAKGRTYEKRYAQVAEKYDLRP